MESQSKENFDDDHHHHVSAGGDQDEWLRYLIVRPENGGIWDLFKYMVWGDVDSAMKFLETGYGYNEALEGLVGGTLGDNKWIILVSIIIRKIIHFCSKPMEWTGYLVDFILNLLYQNGGLLGLLCNILHGTIGEVVIPQRDTETFISSIGHLDGRVELHHGGRLALVDDDGGNSGLAEGNLEAEVGSLALLDLCIMASKLAYENANVVRKVVHHHWKMHLVGFHNCWNEFEKEKSTQVFIFCDKPKDANLIVVSFRGTEPFDADDWITDWDYSWYEIPEMGKVHMGFLEALGLGSRINPSSFKNRLQLQGKNFDSNSNGVSVRNLPESYTEPLSSSRDESPEGMLEMTAYYTVRREVKRLLEEHKNAKFVVTGHSLGGALAILFPTVLVLNKETEILQKLLCIYTFGQPRIGNRKLGKYMETHLQHSSPKYFRVVYCNDLVPRLPYDDKTFLYKHFGACLYYNSLYSEQNVDDEPDPNFFGIRKAIWLHVNAVWELTRGLMMEYLYGAEYREGWFSILMRVMGLALPGISAHCPRNYIDSVRLGNRNKQSQ